MSSAPAKPIAQMTMEGSSGSYTVTAYLRSRGTLILKNDSDGEILHVIFSTRVNEHASPVEALRYYFPGAPITVI